MPISNRNLPEGTTLTATFKKQVYTCSVEAGEDSRLVYRLEDGTSYTSPSAAGSKVMGGVACNGWRFWSVAGGDAAGEATDAPPEPHERTAKVARPKSTPKVKQVRRVPNQRGVPEGEARWFCSACMKGFLTDAGRPPETCPEGHAREVDDEFAPGRRAEGGRRYTRRLTAPQYPPAAPAGCSGRSSRCPQSALSSGPTRS